MPDDTDEIFWGSGGKPAFLARIREQNLEGMRLGVERGWWPSFDEKTATPNPPAQVFKISNFPENATLGHVMAKAKIFPSISIARKNGWDDPIREGDFTVTKRKILVRIIA